MSKLYYIYSKNVEGIHFFVYCKSRMEKVFIYLPNGF